MKRMITLENGVLVFKTFEDFNKVYEHVSKGYLTSASISEVFQGFTSMNMAVKEISRREFTSIEQVGAYSDVVYVQAEGSEYSIEAIVPDLFYGALCNSKGLLRVEKFLIKHAKDAFLVYQVDVSKRFPDLSKLPIHKILKLDNYAKERTVLECVDTYDGGKRKVIGNRGLPLYPVCDPVTSICTLEQGPPTSWVGNKKRSLGIWNFAEADYIGIVGLGGQPNDARHSSLGLGGEHFADDVGDRGGCTP